MRIEELLIRNKENKDIAIEYKDEAISFMDWNIWSKEVGDIISEATDCVGNVAIYIPNSIFYAVAYFAILYEKGTIVPIFYGSTEFEIENTMRFCECDVILTISDEKNKILSALKNYEYSTTVIFVDLMSFVNVLGNYGIITKTNYFVNSGEAEDIAILLHTSGSIASPKRVMLTHTNIINNVIANIESLEMSKNDIGLIALPLVFGYCNTAQFLTHLYLGAKIVIMDGFFFPKTFCELVCSKKITNFTAVPTMLIMLLSYRYCRHYMFYPQLGVKLCSMAGGGVQKIYMVFLREPSLRDRSGSDLFHLRDRFEIKMNFDRNVSCFIFVNALMHDDFFN